ncbi:glycoside hydrolase family 6 protein [Streptomyces sp. HUAS MG91]|uniref:Glucanase n=1 Tax=Streptomyces tabacisoli TaxID=3156398 RepID=A0AAU8IZZ7_9ACTN
MPVPTIRRTPSRTLALGTAALVLAGLATACSGGDSEQAGPREAAGRTAPSPGTADTSPFWVDPASAAAVQAERWEKQGRASDAAVIRRIAQHPQGMWAPGDYPRPVIAEAGEKAKKADKTLVLVAYNIPHRDCGQHSAGGAHSADFYHQWVDAFATGIGDAKALVVLEPDALGHIVDGCTPEEYREERYQLIGSAIDRLKQQPNTKVYVDAGNPAWIPDAAKLVEPLRRAGVERADGFSLNVSNFQTDRASSSYGKQLSQLLGGAHFVVDTSRNGAGPYSPAGADGWCNPPGRALGAAPTTRTGDPLVDAYLWVKRPGESDGTCRGGPAAGTWWAEYALGLARAAHT